MDIRALASGLRRYPDPDRSTDPLIRAIIGQLRALPTPAPSPGFREELRAQLIAVTPRLVAEGVTAGKRRTSTAGPVPRGRRSRRIAPLRRPLAVVGTLLVLFVLLLSGGVWMSSHTLPGDSLYGLKRASENVQLSLTGGDGARGRQYLALAKKRANEVIGLLSRTSALAGGSGPQASGGVNDRTAKLITSTLNDADADTRNGARLLTGQAVRNLSPGPLNALIAWAPDQIRRLIAIADRAPVGAVHTRAVTSQRLAQDALDYAKQLKHELGPKPCATVCNPVTPTPNVPPPGSTTKPAAPPSSPGGSQPSSPPTIQSSSAGIHIQVSPNGAGTVTTPGESGTGSAGTSGVPGTRTGSAILPLPSLTSPPLTVDTCGLHISLGPLGVGIGTCGLDLKL
jgi:hypothetical protein